MRKCTQCTVFYAVIQYFIIAVTVCTIQWAKAEHTVKFILVLSGVAWKPLALFILEEFIVH